MCFGPPRSTHMHRVSDRCSLAQSPAFRAAALRSEVRRASAVLGVIVLTLAIGLRSAWPALPHYVRLTAIWGIGLLIVIQLLILAAVRWARRHDRKMPEWFLL